MDIHSKQALPPNQHFGYLVTAVFILLAAYGGFVKNWGSFATISLSAASLFSLVITLIVPRLLSPFNRAWFFLGSVLGNIISPIVLGAIFFLIITPTALVCRLLGRDELKLKKQNTKSYWIIRTPPGPDAASFKNQF
jgi:hypothetical protein